MQKSFAMAALLAASCGVQAASDADLAAIRAQIDDMKKTYEQRIASLEKKLAEAEVQAKSAKPAAEVKAAPAIVAAAPAATASARANGFNPEVSLILQGQYKNMKDVAERGITGFVPAGGHDEHAAGTVEGINKRGFSVNHTELILGASIDPYWRGQAILALADGEVEVEEAWFQSLAIGHGVGLKGGRVRSGIGYLNEQHPHMWDFADAPLMYRAMFGEHASYAQDGLQFKWLAPTPVFLEFGAEVGRGANFPGTDRNKNGAGAGAIFAHIGGDVGHSNAWRAGVSYLKTKASDREAEIEDTSGKHALGKFTGDSATWLADFVWKWAPNGNPKYQSFKFQSEYFVRAEKGGLMNLPARAIQQSIAPTRPASPAGTPRAFSSSRRNGAPAFATSNSTAARAISASTRIRWLSIVIVRRRLRSWSITAGASSRACVCNWRRTSPCRASPTIS